MGEVPSRLEAEHEILACRVECFIDKKEIEEKLGGNRERNPREFPPFLKPQLGGQ